jgi:hypothetical protein
MIKLTQIRVYFQNLKRKLYSVKSFEFNFKYEIRRVSIVDIWSKYTGKKCGQFWQNLVKCGQKLELKMFTTLSKDTLIKENFASV